MSGRWANMTRNADRVRAQETEQARCAWLIASDLAARAFGADVRVVLQTKGTVGRGSDAKTTRARKVACYLAQVVANAGGARLAEASLMDRATIYQHSSWVEDERERSREFDAQVRQLEDALLAMAARVVFAHLQSRGELPGEAA